MKLGKLLLHILTLILLANNLFADSRNPSSASRRLGKALLEVEKAKLGPTVTKPCSECLLGSDSKSSSKGFDHTLFVNGHVTTPFYFEIAHLNDSLPYLLHLESFDIQSERGAAPDDGLTHGMRYFIGFPLTDNLHLSLESHNLLFTESIMYSKDVEDYSIEALRPYIERNHWEDNPGLGRYNLYLHDNRIKNRRERGQFFSNEYKHVATLKMFSRTHPVDPEETVSGYMLSLGGGIHQLDSTDQDGFFNPVAQQSFLHNTLGWAQSFHNMPKELRDGLARTNKRGAIFVFGVGMTEKGFSKRLGSPIRYTTEAKLKLEGSTLTGASNLQIRGNAEFLGQKSIKSEGRGFFLLFNGGIKVHGDGLFFDFSAGAGYQFETSRRKRDPSFLRFGYKQTFVGGERHNYQLINVAGEKLDNDGLGTFFIRYGF